MRQKKKIALLTAIVIALTFLFNSISLSAEISYADNDKVLKYSISSGEGYAAVDLNYFSVNNSQLSVENGKNGQKSSNPYITIKGAVFKNKLMVASITDTTVLYAKIFSPNNDFSGISFTANKEIYIAPVLFKDINTVIIVFSKSAISDSVKNQKAEEALMALGLKPSGKLNNFKYYGNLQRTYFEIKDYALTDNLTASKKFYTEQWNGNLEYSITFDTPASASQKLGSGTLVINDEFINKAVVNENTSTGKTSITFYLNGISKPIIMTNRRNTTVKSTVISFVKKKSLSEKYVVIDPGHGDWNSSATNGDIWESKVNLAISLKLRDYLEKNGVNTLMTRETDIFVGLYERAYIANALNAALFVSVHNNGAENKQASGTTVFYYETGEPDNENIGKVLARKTKDNLVSTLGSKDRGALPYNDLVVLKATSMPAILVEVGFISNDEEVAKLVTESYQQKAAEAMGNAIIDTLKLN